MSGEEKRKFHNPTPGWVGAVVLDDDNKPKGLPVEPGGHIWLSLAEERLTAEAPRLEQDNPFTKPWREPTEYGSGGEPTAWKDHVGVLVLSPDAARTILSDRFIPSQSAAQADLEPQEQKGDAEPEPAEREITGAPPIPRQPPVEGKPAPDEHVATPDAVAANDVHLAKKAAIHEMSPEDLGELLATSEDASEIALARAELSERQAAAERPKPLGESGPRGQEEIGVQRGAALV